MTLCNVTLECFGSSASHGVHNHSGLFSVTDVVKCFAMFHKDNKFDYNTPKALEKVIPKS